MIIVAKFSSVCPCCLGRINAGERVEWTRGAKAIHADCVGKPAAVAANPGSRQAGGGAYAARVQQLQAAGYRVIKSGSRAWRPCGYPGCSQQYCDECDGEGARG